MRFQFQVSDDLPKLAWCATCQSGNATVKVLLGPWVEKTESFFCEGAWDDEFRQGEFAESFLAGSGGKITDDGNVLFASPSHSLERLHSVRVSNTLHVSNSLTFLLAAIDDKLDPGYFYYRAIFHSIRCGLGKCGRRVPTLKGRQVHLHYYCNLLVSPELTVTEKPKHTPDDFLNFEQYTSFLKDTVIRLCYNALDSERMIAYRPMATVSTGYDSPAAAVFAGAAGCTEAITFADQNDSGAEIARILGMDVQEYDRRAYLQYGGFPEAEFWAGGVNATFAVMLAWEQAIRQRLLVTGFNGEIVWDKHGKPITRDMGRDSPYADQRTGPNCLGEFRLRTGFIHLPIPYIGITNQPSIRSISVSEEMRPWSRGGVYDRPIPRRVVEDAGVKRELFGQHKRGVWLSGVKLTEASRSDFAAFCSENWGPGREIAARVINLFALCYTYAWIIRYKMEHVLERAGLRFTVPPLLPKALTQRLLLRIGKESIMPHWGISRISSRYRMPTSSA